MYRPVRYPPGMLWFLVGALLVLWFLGLLFRAFGGLINVLLVVVVLLIVIYRLVAGRRIT